MPVASAMLLHVPAVYSQNCPFGQARPAMPPHTWPEGPSIATSAWLLSIRDEPSSAPLSIDEPPASTVGVLVPPVPIAPPLPIAPPVATMAPPEPLGVPPVPGFPPVAGAPPDPDWASCPRL